MIYCTVRIFKTKIFTKWAMKSKVTDDALINAALEVSNGVFDASLGGHIFKKRVASKGRGKRGSVRTIIAFKINKHCFYMFGFEKSQKSSLTDSEDRALKLVAKGILEKSDAQLNKLVAKGVLFEVDYE